MDNTYGLETIQRQLLEALMLLDQICRKNEINYSLHGGTLLGAERNHEFIPWDDDIDISMTRDNYRKFKEVLNLKQYPDITLHEDILFASRFVYDNKTFAPVYIDILIYDYITENKTGQFLKINLLRFLQGMIKSRDNLVFSGRNFFYRFSICVTYFIGRLFSLKKKLEWYHHIEENMFLGNKNTIHRSNDTFYGLTHIHDKSFMEEYTDIDFEQQSFMVNREYKEFLRRAYGDNYMTPPPEKDRLPQHMHIRESLKK